VQFTHNAVAKRRAERSAAVSTLVRGDPAACFVRIDELARHGPKTHIVGNLIAHDETLDQPGTRVEIQHCRTV
jgi:hypothetical protein